MSASIESIGIHPIVVLTISDFYNRMRVTSKGKVSRVYGALMGQKIGTKVEIFYAFEFVNNSSDEKIDHAENKNKIVIKTGKKKSIPISFVKNNYRIYIAFQNEKDEKENKYSLLYSNFENLQQNKNNFAKYNEENLSTYKGEKKTKLEDNYSKLITINQNDKNFFISSNLIIQRGNNDTIKETSNPINDFDDNVRLTSQNLSNLLKESDYLNTSKTFSYLFLQISCYMMGC